MIGNKVFITGATGYIGGSIAVKLMDLGYQVTGLVRSMDGAKKLKEIGIIPHHGDLYDYEPLMSAVKQADIVINAADAENSYAVATILTALEGTGKTFVHISGSSIVSDKAAGEYSPQVYHEETIDPSPEKIAWFSLNQMIVKAANRSIRTIVICPTLIYGEGRGIKRDSNQVPGMIRVALERGAAHHVGKGKNVWSTVHIDDLVDLFPLALENAPSGSLFFAGNGEVSFKKIAEKINETFELGTQTKSMTIDDAIGEWGAEGGHYAFSSNSRISAEKARIMLGWKPKGKPVLEDIANGYYKRIIE
ncbi:NAD-dependent epimerase/dehydratase family protein [Virgibacillus sp. NKC19-16]|uniref:NAD-dependent epimerase/dehydratase family protein n=1 Tax=Virgibacillus salidurans TaxID=2831673 RepID=UPI001F2CEA01|nr:NAD-dependent epimerase/dehydratase family protein [Virgibacillus sp. NKC19-16]UJL46468.1 NAD-dependent epimerase/dehydratase family protein [Virgibacillus sp. NKC19-16]